MSLDSAELGSRTSTAGIARGISASKINGHTPTPANANGHAPSAEARALEVQAKYMREREKRIRPDDKPIDVGSLDKFKQFAVDPWIDEGPPVVDIREVVPDRRCKVLILGTGFVGLTAAVRLLQSGIDVEEIRMVDTACNFGGTWYWNRYPGLMCDIESYIYMPLLEETGYMPKYKYSYDTELRDYANLIADQFKLRDKTVFQTAVRSATWDDVEKEWVVELRQDRRGHEAEAVQLRTEMFCIAGGIVHHPRIPNLAGLENFKGHSFHTARWDYRYTGGSPSDWNLMGLDDKRVGFVGTGATGIQAVTQLARNAKELYVFQRTPSAVDVREQQPTDPKWWSKYSSEKGWQRKRSENFCAHFVHPSNHPKVNLVDDAWTRMPTFGVLIGGITKIRPSNLDEYLSTIHALDFPRQERLRARIANTVHDPSIASKLTPWFPGWCKRPCFHDDYLPSFNRPNVHLVDTDGAGISSLTSTGVVVGDKTYDVDVLIFGTGFRSAADSTVASRANMTVTGRHGEDLHDKLLHRAATLHGCVSRNFPNLFFFGPAQSGATAHWIFPADMLAQHVGYMLRTARERVGGPSGEKRVLIEPTQEAEEKWTQEVLERSLYLKAIAGCTPSHLNAEGALDKRSEREQNNSARGVVWGDGYLDFLRVIEEWREDGRMEGLDVKVV